MNTNMNKDSLLAFYIPNSPTKKLYYYNFPIIRESKWRIGAKTKYDIPQYIDGIPEGFSIFCTTWEAGRVRRYQELEIESKNFMKNNFKEENENKDIKKMEEFNNTLENKILSKFIEMNKNINDKQNNDELEEPIPNGIHKYCHICNINYDNYLIHIKSFDHFDNLKKNKYYFNNFKKSFEKINDFWKKKKIEKFNIIQICLSESDLINDNIIENNISLKSEENSSKKESKIDNKNSNNNNNNDNNNIDNNNSNSNHNDDININNNVSNNNYFVIYNTSSNDDINNEKITDNDNKNADISNMNNSSTKYNSNYNLINNLNITNKSQNNANENTKENISINFSISKYIGPNKNTSNNKQNNMNITSYNLTISPKDNNNKTNIIQQKENSKKEAEQQYRNKIIAEMEKIIKQSKKIIISNSTPLISTFDYNKSLNKKRKRSGMEKTIEIFDINSPRKIKYNHFPFLCPDNPKKLVAQSIIFFK